MGKFTFSGAPGFVAEVAVRTVNHDLGPKLNADRRNGIAVPTVQGVRNAAIDWFALREGGFEQVLPDPEGVTRRVAFPALWLRTPGRKHLTTEAQRAQRKAQRPIEY